MTVRFQCPRCSKNLTTGDEWVGKKVACPGCQQVMQVPGSSAPSQPGTAASQEQVVNKPSEYRFDCPQCGKSIRVPAKYAGRKGACPRCHTKLIIPSPPATGGGTPSTAPSSPSPPAAQPEAGDPLGGLEGLDLVPVDENPFGSGFTQPQPGAFPAPAPATPYKAPMRPQAPVGPRPHQRVVKPPTPTTVIMTKVIGISILVLAIINFIFHGISMSAGLMTPRAAIERQIGQRQVDVDPEIVYVMMFLAAIFVAGFCGFQGFAGYQMFNLQYWGVALAGSICAIVPCVCYSSFISIPIGIVGIVMLCQGAVKDAFK